MPYRTQSVCRNQNEYHRVPRATSERPSHSCNVFCRECFSRIFMGSTAFKIYLLIAWCVGLAGLMCIQRPSRESMVYDSNQLVAIVILIIYLLSQLFGLLAALTEIEKFFIPYLVILAMATLTNLIVLVLSAYAVVTENYFSQTESSKRSSEFHVKPSIVLTSALVFLIYNLQCFSTVIHLCSHFDKKKLLAAQRRREVMAHNARVYARLIAMQNELPSVVTMNMDSPPKYSVIETKPFSDTPPPVYCQVTVSSEDHQEQEEKKKTIRRALFQDSQV